MKDKKNNMNDHDNAISEISVNPLLVMGTSEWSETMPIEEYHAYRGAVNASNLKFMLESPATFYANFYGEKEKKETESMRIGSLVHAAVLEGERFWKTHIIAPEFGDLRSSKNREAKIAWLESLAPDSTVIEEYDVDTINGCVEGVMAHPDAMKILQNGKAELTGMYNDEETGIRCKIRPDFLAYNLTVLIDLKTTRNSSARKFSNNIIEHGYDFQMAMYSAGVKALTGKQVDQQAWIAIETEPPYECAVYVADVWMMDRGITNYRKSLKKLHECLTTNVWPKRQQRMEEIHLPRWVESENN